MSPTCLHGCRHFAHSVHTLVRTLAQPLSLPVPLPVTLPVPVPLTQTVRLRRTVPKQQHCTPFTCSFVPRYAKYTIAQLRALDAALREEVWPDLGAGKLPDKGEVERWFWEGLASEARVCLASYW